jgi:hypothetical protein
MNTPDCKLECGCWKRVRLDAARIGQVVWCKFDGWQGIASVNLYEWHVHCMTDGCHYGRWCGQSEHEARLRNTRHVRKHEHLGGVQYDRITWDGRGSIFRNEVDRSARTTVRRPPILYKNKVRNIEDVAPPPF